MKTDADLKRDVVAELNWDPAVKSTAIGVAVKDGVVTLTGQLDTFAEKHAASRAVQRVAGVHQLAHAGGATVPSPARTTRAASGGRAAQSAATGTSSASAIRSCRFGRPKHSRAPVSPGACCPRVNRRSVRPCRWRSGAAGKRGCTVCTPCSAASSRCRSGPRNRPRRMRKARAASRGSEKGSSPPSARPSTPSPLCGS